jgi:hypothetical protein
VGPTEVSTIETSIFAFATDLRDEGVDVVLDNVVQRAGLGAVSLAVAYHHARDVFPHSPARKVRFLEGGTVFFRPQERRYERLAIKPRVSDLARAADPLAELVRKGAGRSIDVHAWTVFLHNYTLGRSHPDCVERNAFGDPYLTDLCPANPEVRAYVAALAADVARYGVRTIVAESLHYHPLEHGYHHERYLIELGASASFLLGLCFCEHCLAAARRLGVDAGTVRRAAAREIERVFDSEPPASGPEVLFAEVADLAAGEMEGYLRAREETVSSLVAEVAGALAGSEARLAFMDPSGAAKGYATGRPTGDPSPSIGWRFGIDLRALEARCDQLEIVGYAADPARLRTDLESYREVASPDAQLAAILRPMAPDCDRAENLARKVELCAELGLVRVDFYHYGLMRLRNLDWVAEAVRAK